MKTHLLRVFVTSWFSFALFFTTVLSDRTFQQSIVRGVVSGFVVGLVMAGIEWARQRHKERRLSA